jgi:hypothetical protein
VPRYYDEVPLLVFTWAGAGHVVPVRVDLLAGRRDEKGLEAGEETACCWGHRDLMADCQRCDARVEGEDRGGDGGVEGVGWDVRAKDCDAGLVAPGWGGLR